MSLHGSAGSVELTECMCVHVCVCVGVRACVRVCVCVCENVGIVLIVSVHYSVHAQQGWHM